MSTLCSVPMDFLVMRGQGIKLTSYIAKKCREKNTLMPVIDKSDNNDEGYEGAIVLPPKCDLYLNDPVACVDYSSLYPSSMISENISHDSKVWTKEYDLHDVLLERNRGALRGRERAINMITCQNINMSISNMMHINGSVRVEILRRRWRRCVLGIKFVDLRSFLRGKVLCQQF